MIVRHATLDVSSKAATRLAELGLEEELDRVVEYTRSMIPTLSELKVATFSDKLEPDGVTLMLAGIKEAPYVRRDPEHRAWKRGVLALVSNHFLRWFRFDVLPREAL